MKLSEHWLREWVNPALSREALGESLTMAGLEIEELSPVTQFFSGVVVAQVLKVEKHPEADRLQVCQVDIGKPEPVTIVCGAKNVVPGMKTAAALEGAVLPGDFKIKASKLRNVMSYGMLCGADELGLAEESNGLITLPQAAPIGVAVWDYLNLDDYVMDVSITPNRGDCLSVAGLAQDISAITHTPVTVPFISPVPEQHTDVLSVTLNAPAQCPRYVGRIIRHIKADAATPIWMQERLRRGGIRSIHPIVDVMNYVMLELGQPMHSFDLAKITGNIQVRLAKAHEQLKLLDGQTVTLDTQSLIIADEHNPLAIAGVMGGFDSGVTSLTQDVFLESAFFQPMCVAQMSRHYKLTSDSSYRFERGVDPMLQVKAIERATQLILDITGGEAGPIVNVVQESYLPQSKQITLRATYLKKLLGFSISDQDVGKILTLLGFTVTHIPDGWNVTVPARRFDITIEADLIEEVIRIHGYDKIPQQLSVSGMQINPRSEKKVALAAIRHALCDMGYREVVTYSFIDKKIQNLFNPTLSPKELLNPITADMAVMRTSLWPGLVNTFLYNQNRQQNRVRIFETGLRFIPKSPESLEQEGVLSILAIGDVLPVQWGENSRAADFFDLKGDIQNLLKLTHDANNFEFKPGQHSALHPGQTADIYRSGEYVGTFGMLHPAIAQKLDINGKLLLAELLTNKLETAKLPHFSEISKFPEISRDLAILVDQSVPAKSIQDTISYVAGDLLQAVNIFDIYQGKGIAEGRKSLALSLTLQHSSRTLVDEEVAELMSRIIVTLQEKFAAELRG